MTKVVVYFDKNNNNHTIYTNMLHLNKDDIRYIVESVIKEYHQYQQLMLPFDGSDEPYNDMQFMEWVDEHSTRGKLPPAPGAMNKILSDPNIMFEVGCSNFYYGLGEELDTEGYYEFLFIFAEQNGEGVLQPGETVDSIIDAIPNVQETKSFLTENGAELWRRAIIDTGIDTMKWWINERLQINEQGLIYCERMIDIEYSTDRYKDDQYKKDYYETLEDMYSGIGEYWSYCPGGGAVYFNVAKHAQEVLIRGWVSPDSVDWETTISLDSMDEQELRLYGDATVQIDSMEIWAPESGKVNLLGNRGSILMKIS